MLKEFSFQSDYTISNIYYFYTNLNENISVEQQCKYKTTVFNYVKQLYVL